LADPNQALRDTIQDTFQQRPSVAAAETARLGQTVTIPGLILER
jgi:hypothetical protein